MAEDKFKVSLLAPNIAEVVLKDNVYLDIAVTDGIEQELERLGPDQKFYQLVIASGPYIVNPEMRNAVSKGTAAVRQLAIAWVSPDERANKEQEEITSKLPLPLPIRFFSDREIALAWLKTLADAK